MLKLIYLLALSRLSSAQDPPQQVTLNKGSPPNTMRLSCDGVSSPTWSHDGTNIYVDGKNKQPTVYTTSNGRILSNTQALGGQYIGSYECFDLNNPRDTLRSYDVVIPGATNLSGGAIAGIIIGVLLALLLIAGVIFFGYRQGWFGENDKYDDNEEGNDILEDGNMNETNSTARFKKPHNNNRSDNGVYT